jgi:hypothetical protein
MKHAIKNKRTIRCMFTTFNRVDSHKWASKMEIQHLTSSKPNVAVMAKLKNHLCII